MLFDKKGLGVVVAMSLLIVVSVATVYTFNNWYETYSYDLFVKAEKKSKTNSLNIISVNENLNELEVYAKTDSSYVFVNDIKVNDVTCTLLGSDVIDDKVTLLNIDCSTQMKGKKNKLLVYTNQDIYAYEFYV